MRVSCIPAERLQRVRLRPNKLRMYSESAWGSPIEGLGSNPSWSMSTSNWLDQCLCFYYLRALMLATFFAVFKKYPCYIQSPIGKVCQMVLSQYELVMIFHSTMNNFNFEVCYISMLNSSLMNSMLKNHCTWNHLFMHCPEQPSFFMVLCLCCYVT